MPGALFSSPWFFLQKGDLHGIIALKVSWWEYISSAKATLFLCACYFTHRSLLFFFFKYKSPFPPHQNVCEVKQTFFLLLQKYVGEKILLEFYGCLNGSAVGGKEKEHRKEMDSRTQSKSDIPLCSETETWEYRTQKQQKK